ncbi:alpha/beta hydrolase [Xanthomonas citri pv. mangiferaeindicae]|nr:alpha/beta hydrolase [Xanthomonas citri pv. mangiferaeindicae]
MSRVIRHSMVPSLPALLLAALLALAAWPVFAQGRHYTVTAPDGVAIAVEEAGDPAGRPIVLVHGLLGSRLNWEAQLRSADLAGYRLIAYDLRGHGRSGKPDDAAAYTDGARWADELAAVIEASGAQAPVLVGWSLGAAVVTEYLARHGDAGIAGAVYVGGVVELDPSLLQPHPSLYQGMADDDLRTHLDAERAFLALCFAHPPETVTFERLLAGAALASDRMQAAVPSMTMDAAGGLGRLHKPLLLLHGARDALVRPEPSIARARTLKPDAQTMIYADIGHAPFAEAPARFNQDLVRFVEATAPH